MMEIVETTRTVGEWLQLMCIGLLAGMLGQAARTVVGLKKLNDKAEEQGTDFAELFSAAKLVVSLLIGAVAGTFAALALGLDLAKLSTLHVFGLVAAGYTGADFIEGFMTRMMPKTPESDAVGNPAKNVGTVVNNNPVTVVPAAIPAGDDAVG